MNGFISDQSLILVILLLTVAMFLWGRWRHDMVAAGSLLVTEAGGLIGNFAGESEYLELQECLAANPKVYAQLVSVLRKHSKFEGEARGPAKARGHMSLQNPAADEADGPTPEQALADALKAADTPAGDTPAQA